MADAGAITVLLRSSAAGDDIARRRLWELVYPDMRRMANACFRGESSGHTLQPTALVHETCMRLLGHAGLDFNDRIHLYATASRQMRRILVDYARRRRTRRLLHDTVSHRNAIPPVETAILLDRLAQIDSRAADVVDLRFWGGLNELEIAEVLNVSVSTVRRDWNFARLWLRAEYRAS